MDSKIPLFNMPEEVDISHTLTPEEQPTVKMKILEVKKRKTEPKGKSFHEKKDKNKKVNVKLSREDKKKIKYGRKYKRER